MDVIEAKRDLIERVLSKYIEPPFADNEEVQTDSVQTDAGRTSSNRILTKNI